MEKLILGIIPGQPTCGIRGLTVTPNVNLVTNIGFGEDATHTKSFNELESSVIPSQPLKKVTYPRIIKIDNEADIFGF